MGSCCGSQPKRTASCPDCHQVGMTVEAFTLQHTLRHEFRNEISSSNRYYFCEAPECRNTYFSEDGKQRFTTKQLINRVTCKDPSEDTPLCYCFKITKGDALKEYRESGNSSVLEQVENKMAEKSCFCDKSNPRGVCCTTEIKSWLKTQGIGEGESSSTGSCCNSNCC